MADIKFDIKEEFGILSEGSRGWKKEINLVSWNDRKPKIDIRDWDENRGKMGKGITLNKTELLKLKEILNSMDLEAMEIE
ncbi:MAG TPA: PC4/YdbC family ssDNA-binding protein [Syntrophomonadaceae bacterium]|jgi:hypothetical protein|nr:PC4/YdbC family ssDNA-binding protein [Syntrophomonadaceae bacterium]HRX21053.1 PC4/YdbC family ssDNA-binding protein [Syntrophomonadaceae bacterium]